jgi:tRNA-splicing ligase RtcB (3'-phosphate/5'-hydroxy nucleic acid ligase)
VIPAAVGSDINCGMRLHVVDLTVDAFLAKRNAFVDAMKGDYFFGTRDLPMTAASFKALFRDGLLGWIDVAKPMGALASSRFDQIERELERVFGAGSFLGDPFWAPEDLVLDDGVLRDGGLATIGGGNHFVEVQVVDDVVDRSTAYAWGVKKGQLTFMIHSGSRGVGKHVGGAWRDKARAAWPRHAPFPHGELFALSSPELRDSYLRAEATAANYGFLNRMLLAELLRLRLRQLFGDVDAPLVYDLPHNITLREDGAYVVRKGACPAHGGQPVIIPGSMGAPSFLLKGCGSAQHLCSASHGAGRAKSRFEMDREGADLVGVDCITLREERLIQEAPSAYKPIEPVIDCQVKAGIVTVVAKLRPILTFKA